ncbi:zinc finger, CCHC-type containing protein [Tanacetum coccineum]
MDESLLVRKLLDSTPDRFIQIVASIEQTSDLDDISLDEIIGKLKAFEERIKLRKGGQVKSQENLPHKGNSNKNKVYRNMYIIRKDCRGTSTTQEQSNLILEEDDEPSLLMTTHETEHEEVLLNEGQIQPGKYASGDASMWYLDNGASNHMTGTKSHFKDIDESVSGRAYFLTSKDQAFSTFKEFRQQIEMEMRMKLRMLRTDRGGEFTSNEFTKYCKENGIARQLTAPYSPQQNGVVERRNRTVLSTTRSMMKAMKLPLTFWAEAVRHAIYILNRVPTRALIDKTPYEALYNRKPNLENLRIFGCTAYAKITIPHLKKLDDRSIPLIYLGVEEGSKACRLYDPIAKKKHVSRDVRFMETKPWDWDKDGVDTSTQDTFWTSFVNAQEVENVGETLVFTEEEPRNYKEASTDKKWIGALEIKLGFNQ